MFSLSGDPMKMGGRTIVLVFVPEFEPLLVDARETERSGSEVTTSDEFDGVEEEDEEVSDT